jgi:GNAT superfamily N-acetyltransferase
MVQDRPAVRRIGREAVRIAAMVLSRAFQDDPVFAYFVPDEGERRAKSRYIMNMLVEYSVNCGEVTATSGFEAVAVWLPHNRVEVGFWEGVRNGGLSALLHLGPACIRRQLNASDAMCRAHTELAPYPHCYLYLLGSEPLLRGKGYAGTLMRSMLARLDAQGTPAYLDNTNRKNTAMYEHYGFKAIREYTISGTDVLIWAMGRQSPKRV